MGLGSNRGYINTSLQHHINWVLQPMSETEWTVDESTDEATGPAIEVQGVSDPREPEDGESVQEYSLSIASENGIKNLGVKYNGDMVTQNGDVASTEVSELDGTLRIGKHDSLA